MEADATDTDGDRQRHVGVAALNARVLARDLPPNLQAQPVAPISGGSPFALRSGGRDGPEHRARADRYDLTFTLVITALSITREREAGTMENLLAMPVRPLEVMLGKPFRMWGWAMCRCC